MLFNHSDVSPSEKVYVFSNRATSAKVRFLGIFIQPVSPDTLGTHLQECLKSVCGGGKQLDRSKAV